MKRINFRIPASLSYRPIAIGMVSMFAEHVEHGDRAFRNDVVTAFGEAFNNVVIHGYRGRSDGMLEVEVELGANQLTLNLIDSGRQIDFSGAGAPDLEQLPEHGMGIFMIYSLVDEVAYRCGNLNVLSLTKRTKNGLNGVPGVPSVPNEA